MVHFSDLYKQFEADILHFKVEQEFIKRNIFLDQGYIMDNFLQQIKDGNFSSVACKIHQHFAKESLKMEQIQKDKKVYNIKIRSSVTLIEMEMQCANKTICKNMAGLKYIEIYCFEVF